MFVASQPSMGLKRGRSDAVGHAGVMFLPSQQLHGSDILPSLDVKNSPPGEDQCVNIEMSHEEMASY